MIAPDLFALADHEKTSILWVRLQEHLNEKLTAARRRNDAPMSEAETATLRGEIKTLKWIIALGDDRPMTGETGAP